MALNKYALIFVFFTFSVTVIFAGINFFIDPYMMYGSSRIIGVNDIKPAAANRAALYKPYNIINIRPQTVIIGNSRPEMGLNPNSTCWPAESGVVYSLTFPGMSTYGQVRALFHSVAMGGVKKILLGVDFADFLYKRKKKHISLWPSSEGGFYDRLLVDEDMQENKWLFFSKIKDFSKGLFSLTSLNDSVYTLVSQSQSSSNRTRLGFNVANDYKEIIRYEGKWVLFEQKISELERMFSKPDLSIYDYGQWSLEFEAVKRAIQLSLDKNIELTIFINPYHYTYLEIINKSGYWGDFESFKRTLAYVVKKYGNGKVNLWDFSLFSNYTTLPAPKKGVGTQGFNWFWEPAHYKSELGELMLSDIFETNCSSAKNEPVGRLLNFSKIDDHLISQKDKRLLLFK